MGLRAIIDSQGAPLLLADTPEPERATREATREQAAEQDRQDLVRRRDAVVDAARTMDDLSPDGVREFVSRRARGTKVMTDADVSSFSVDAIKHRELDVADALDGRARRGVYGRQDKHVAVSFPRGWLRQSLRAMSDDEVAGVLGRLRDRGWSQAQVDKYVIKPYRAELSRNSAK